ncbi:cytochrome P450 [Jimgerdemannia flammicorona]|uniref:Cytochrome P450 n=1 Tax=Jimgerdemannia flammicorona TaxID=994334 RepID=A0A433PEE6_9FUNG|nr:cytochrome P450 [Jimgerdemannia flammicorona]
MVPAFFRLTEKFANIWEGRLKPGNEETEFPRVLEDISKLTLDIIGLAAFGEEIGALSSDSANPSPLHENYVLLAKPQPTPPLWKATFLHLLLIILPQKMATMIPERRHQEVMCAMRRIRDVTWKLVQEKKSSVLKEKEEAVEDGDEKKREKEEDLLGVLIKMNQEEDGLSDKELQAQIMTFLAAGILTTLFCSLRHDTTSAALAWALWLLAQNPEAQKKLREEVTPMFKDALNNKTPPSYDDIDALKYLNAVCKEELRLIPPGPMLSHINVALRPSAIPEKHIQPRYLSTVPTAHATSRQATKDTELGGYYIPKGTILIIAPTVIHRLPRIWGEDVLEFRPERWFEKPAMDVGPYEYLPFSVGPRHCIGYKLALMEMKVILGILITRFEFAEVPGWNVRRKSSITCKPTPEMKLLVRRV